MNKGHRRSSTGMVEPKNKPNHKINLNTVYRDGFPTSRPASRVTYNQEIVKNPEIVTKILMTQPQKKHYEAVPGTIKAIENALKAKAELQKQRAAIQATRDVEFNNLILVKQASKLQKVPMGQLRNRETPVTSRPTSAERKHYPQTNRHTPESKLYIEFRDRSSKRIIPELRHSTNPIVPGPAKEVAPPAEQGNRKFESKFTKTPITINLQPRIMAKSSSMTFLRETTPVRQQHVSSQMRDSLHYRDNDVTHGVVDTKSITCMQSGAGITHRYSQKDFDNVRQGQWAVVKSPAKQQIGGTFFYVE